MAIKTTTQLSTADKKAALAALRGTPSTPNGANWLSGKLAGTAVYAKGFFSDIGSEYDRKETDRVYDKAIRTGQL